VERTRSFDRKVPVTKKKTAAEKVKKEAKQRGPETLYPFKDRARSIHVQMPDRLHTLLAESITRLRVRPGDLFCALLERYGKSIKVRGTMTPEDTAALIETMKKRGRI